MKNTPILSLFYVLKKTIKKAPFLFSLCAASYLLIPFYGSCLAASDIERGEDRETHFPKLRKCVDHTRINSVEEISKGEELWALVFSEGGTSKIKSYLSKGANPNLTDCATETGRSRSLLQLYARQGNAEMVSLLLEKGAIVSYFDQLKRNALHSASFEGHSHILSLCLAHVSSSSGEKDLRQELVDWPDVFGFTPLHMASDKGNKESIIALLRYGAKVDPIAFHGVTPLHLACYRGNDEAISLLLDYGADPSKRHENGLSSKDFYKLGELSSNLKRNPALFERLSKESGRLMSAQRQELMSKNPSLSLFKETFQRKCSSIFLAYRTLESGAIQTTKDDLCVSNIINLLGTVVSLPGTGIALEALSMVAGAVEDYLEEKKREFLTHFFLRVDTMENAVEESAYALVDLYKVQIQQLTTDGAETLALCAIGRFLEYMRALTLEELENKQELCSYVLRSVSFKIPEGFLNTLPYLQTRIETTDPTLKWTERSIFEESPVDSVPPVTWSIVPVEISSSPEGQVSSFSGNAGDFSSIHQEEEKQEVPQRSGFCSLFGCL